MAILTEDGPLLDATAGRSGRSAAVKIPGTFAFHVVLVRLFTLCLGLAAIVWGTTTFPIFWRQRPIEDTAAAIIGHDAFRPHALDRLLPAVAQIEQSQYCRPEALQSAAIVRLRLAENAMAAGERTAIDGRLSQLENTIRRSLACAPSDSFLWMVLAWLDDARNGFRPQQLTYLRLSYELGPNEGWVAARRNRLALSMFGRLPTDLADTAVHEFARMVDSWIYWELDRDLHRSGLAHPKAAVGEPKECRATTA